MKNKRSLFVLISCLCTVIFALTSCSNFVNDLQKRKNQNLYNVKIQDSRNGSVTASKSTGIKAGEEVILTVEPNQGYKVKNLTAITLQNKDIAVAAVEHGASYKFTMPDSDVTVNAIFEKQGPIDISNPEDLSSSNGNTLYRIEHYQQDVDDLDSYTLYAIQKKRGSAGEETEVVAQTYQGFNSLSFAQQTITADGSTVIEIYYNRKTITYTFDPNGGNWDGSTDTVTVSGLYGAVIDKPQNPQRSGYDFSVWDDTSGVFGPENKTISGLWTARTDTKYTVKTYEQNVDGSYTLLSSSEKTGITDTTTNVTADSPQEGFNLTINQANIDGDGSSIVNVYYNRKLYTIAFYTNGGSEIPDQQVLHGAKVQMPDAPTKDNYRFYKWYTESTFDNPFNTNTTITSAKSLYASWIDSSITYEFQETVRKLDAGTDGTYGTRGEYVMFGDFPQSAKADNVTVDENITMKMGDMMLYGGNDGCLYAKVESLYYKVGPIKWRVLSKDANGKAVLLAEKILINCEWECEWTSNLRTVFFIYSDIFEYLNSAFLNYAFTNAAQEKIEITTIISEGYDDAYGEYFYWNSYSDDAKIFLLSENEAFGGYEFSNNSRIRNPTAYATAKGADRRWWLRSYYSNSNDSDFYIHIVNNSGKQDKSRGNVSGGVVPALTIYLPDED